MTHDLSRCDHPGCPEPATYHSTDRSAAPAVTVHFWCRPHAPEGAAPVVKKTFHPGWIVRDRRTGAALCRVDGRELLGADALPIVHFTESRARKTVARLAAAGLLAAKDAEVFYQEPVK